MKIDLYEHLAKLQKQEEKLAHLELHKARLSLIEMVEKGCREDDRFRELVETQLSLYHSTPDSRTFYAVCNEPGHLIRERLIAWFIDHPKNN